MSKKCPKCNRVFDDDSLIVCPDCQEELVSAEISEKKVSVFSLTSEESAQGVVDYMKEQGIEGSYQYNLREKNYKIYVSQADARAALRACTSFYAEEAKRLKAEEDKRRAEEEAKRKAEEEARRAEEERIRAEEEAKRKAEEEARRQAEEEARKIREAEEERIRAEEEAVRAAAMQAEKERLEAEEAVRKAEEAAKLAEEAALRQLEEAERQAAEAARLEAEKEERIKEEAKRAAEAEAQRRIEEEKARQRAASEKRRKMFEEGIRDFEANSRREAEAKKASAIPHVTAETIVEETEVKTPDIEIIPEKGPIFVETEPVEEYAVGDTIVVDAVDVEISEDDFYNFGSTVEEEPSFDGPQVNDFLSGIKKKTFNTGSLFGGDDIEEEPVKETIEQPVVETVTEPVKEVSEPVVEDMFTDNLFKTKSEEVIAEPVKEEASSTFEEIINKNVNQTVEEPKVEEKEPEKPVEPAIDLSKVKSTKMEAINSLDEVADGSYRGFVPDYHQEDNSIDPDVAIAQAYGFSAEEYKKLKANTEKKAKDHKNSPAPKAKPENKEFKLVEEAPLNDIKGFVPDYSQKEAEKMSYYTKRTTIDYSKYRSGGNDNSDRNPLADLNCTLRSSTQVEMGRLFEASVIKNAAKPNDYMDLKSSNYILALTGGQLNSLLTSWLMINCTSVSVKQFEKLDASADQNYNNKIDGIKNLLKSNFGKLDDTIIDIIVKKFYNKYLDE